MSRVDRSTVCVGLLVLLMPVLAGSATADYSYVAPGIGNQDFRRGEPDDPSPHSQPCPTSPAGLEQYHLEHLPQ